LKLFEGKAGDFVLKIKNKGRTSYFEVENEEQGAKPVKRSYFY
jgi:hypothetical protein